MDLSAILGMYKISDRKIIPNKLAYYIYSQNAGLRPAMLAITVSVRRGNLFCLDFMSTRSDQRVVGFARAQAILVQIFMSHSGLKNCYIEKRKKSLLSQNNVKNSFWKKSGKF